MEKMVAPGTVCSACSRYPGRSTARDPQDWDALRMAGPPIERAEVVALLFNVSDIAVGVEAMVRLLSGGDDGEEEEADES